MESKKKNRNLRALLISLGITLVLLAVVMGMAWWYQNATGMELDAKGIWIANGIGGLLVFLILYHFIKKPKE